VPGTGFVPEVFGTLKMQRMYMLTEIFRYRALSPAGANLPHKAVVQFVSSLCFIYSLFTNQVKAICQISYFPADFLLSAKFPKNSSTRFPLFANYGIN